MSDLIEAMAKALCKAEGFDVAHWDGLTGERWKAHIDDKKPKYRKMARAALASIPPDAGADGPPETIDGFETSATVAPNTHPPADLAGMDGLVERLRGEACWRSEDAGLCTTSDPCTPCQAAVAIQSLAAQVVRLGHEINAYKDALAQASGELARAALENKP